MTGAEDAGDGPDVAMAGAARAREGNRTPDLFITSESLCRLSYPGAGVRLPAGQLGQREEKGL